MVVRVVLASSSSNMQFQHLVPCKCSNQQQNGYVQKTSLLLIISLLVVVVAAVVVRSQDQIKAMAVVVVQVDIA
jgi:hypothetical protein